MKRLLLALMFVIPAVAHAYIVTSSTILADPTQDLVSAIEALPSTGGELQLGPGRYTISSTIRLDRPIRLRGAGMGVTVIAMDTSIAACKDSDLVKITSRYVSIEDLKLHGTGVAGLGRGVVIQSRIADAIWKISLRNVTVDSTSNSCLYLPNAGIQTGRDSLDIVTGANSVILCSFENCWFKENKSGSQAVYIGEQHTTLTFKDCSITRYIGCGIRMSYAYGNNYIGGNIEEQLAAGAPGIVLANSANNRFEHVWFENTTTHQSDYPITLTGGSYGNKFKDCNFQYGNLIGNSPQHNPRIASVGDDNTSFCYGNTFENLWATIPHGSLSVGYNFYIGPNSRDTKVINCGISDLNGSSPVSGTLVDSTFTLASGTYLSTSWGIDVGDPVYPTTGLPQGTYVSAVNVTGNPAKLTLSNYTGAARTAGTYTGLNFSPGGKIFEMPITDVSQTRPYTTSSNWRQGVPRLTSAQLALIASPAPGDMVWVTDIATAGALKVWNGSAWKYVSQN